MCRCAEEPLTDSLRALIHEINRVRQEPGQLVRVAELCKQALAKIPAGKYCKQWAWLHAEIANCLTAAPASLTQAQAESALEHYRLALEVYTPEANLTSWALVTHNMARLYEQQIVGQPEQDLRQAIQLYDQLVDPRYRGRLAPEEEAEDLAALARLYLRDPDGERAQNVEKGIEHCRRALDLLDDRRSTAQWARTKDLLGTLYRRRWGERPVADLETSLQHHRDALQAIEPLREQDPQQWAIVQHNLGVAYWYRARGRRGENLQNAIHHLEQALRKRTRERNEKEWADTQRTLALAHMRWPGGEQRGHMARAVEILDELETYYRGASPIEQACYERVLGDAHQYKSHESERTENIELAIEHYGKAIAHLDKATESQDVAEQLQERARTLHNLAVAYSERPLGAREDNLRCAAQHAKEALQAIDGHPRLRWALINVDLVDILWKLANVVKGVSPSQGVKYLDKAIEHGEVVVQFFAGQPIFDRLALAHYNLGNAYGDRAHLEHTQSDCVENQAKAIAHYKRALTFYDRFEYPVRWANTHNNLGATYSELGTRSQAIWHYERAMTVLREGVPPVNARYTGRNLGNVYLDVKRWRKAANAFQVAIQASDALYQTSLLRQSKEAELEQAGALYRNAAYALARDKDIRGAVEILEQGRAHLLAEALARDRRNLDALRTEHPDLYAQFDQAASTLEHLVREELSLSGEALRAKIDDIRTARQDLDEAAHKVRITADPHFLSVPTFDEVTRAVRPDRPLVYLVSTPFGGVSLLVSPRGPEAIRLDGLDDRALRSRVDRWRETRAAFEKAWRDLLRAGKSADRTTEVAYLDTRKLWYEVIESTTRWLWNHAVGSSVNRLRALGYTRAEWVPTGLLALLPLHAAWYTVDGRRRYAVEDVAFAYTPSARALEHAQRTADTVPADSLFAIDDPRGDMQASTAEVEAIQRHFASDKEPIPWIVSGHMANASTVKAALSQRSVLHLSCHGVNNPNEPLASALELALGQAFTAGDLLVLEDQTRARLVFLSACETGLIGTRLPDEVVGWPAAFLQAGAAGVVSSLWAVNAHSTASLVRLFYDRWLVCGEEPTDALAHAQRCLIGSTHPFHWAGFSFTGV